MACTSETPLSKSSSSAAVVRQPVWRRRRSLLLLWCFLLPLTGCTLGTRYVALSYPPPQQEELEANVVEANVAVNVSTNAISPRTAGVVLNVEDVREDDERIGVVRNGYGVATTTILTEDTVVIWAHDAINTELEALGYTVVDDLEGAVASDTYDRLDAQLTKLYCDIFMFYDGEVTLRATLHPLQGESLRGEFPAKVNSGFSWTASDKGTGKSLAQAMQESSRAMLAELGFVPRR